MTESIRGGRIVVVDGSNIATEGRSVPSLAQLNDAVLSFRDEHPEAAITVVVDATFGHRIDKSERKQFDEAVAHNEVVAPPAGAVGRGDAFVLSIANKVGATILSNDSFQEFHGDFPWLFDDGRLVGGKPVPHIGWVFVDRVPVKGPVSRKARNASKRRASKRASEPMPVPTSPPPAATMRQARAVQPEVAGAASVEPAEAATNPAPLAKGAKRRGGSTAPINDLLPFLDFVEHHPVGSSVTGVVESYASHGAYVTIGDVRGYVPLRLMGEPPPRSARDVMRLGETVTLVVAAFTAARRNVDLAVPGVEAADDGTAPLEPEAAITEALAEAVAETAAQTAADAAATSPKPVKRAAKKAAKKVAKEPTKQAARKRPAKKAATRKETASKAPAKKAAAEKPSANTAPAKKAPAKKTPGRKTPAKKAAADKAAAKKAAAKKAPSRRAAGKQAAAEQSA